MSAVDALGITLNTTPEMSTGSFKKLRDLEGAGSGDFSAVITAKISTSIQDLKPSENIRDISMSTASKDGSASFERVNSKIKDESYGKKDTALSFDGKVKDAVERFERDVKAEIKKVLDVSDEDIEDAMEKLSLSYTDLSDVSKLSMLFMELSGVSEQSELLLTDGFLELKNSVAALSNELFSETGLDMEGIVVAKEAILSEDAGLMEPLDTTENEELSGNVQISGEDTPVLSEGDAAKENAAVSPELPEKNDEPQEVQKDAVSTPVDDRVINEEVRTEKKNIEEKDAPLKEAPSDTAKDTVSETETAPAELRRNRDSSEKGSAFKEEEGTEDINKQPVKTVSPEQTQNQGSGLTENRNEQAQSSNIFNNNTVAEAPAENPEVPVTPYSQQGINPSDIARQMVQNVRTVVTESLKTMEVQLNPENLGRMIIHVSEQDGQLTARINIQNENVRSAMEEQMAIVKNNLEAQGLKIESVTVTSDAHEFERNLEEGNAPKNDMNSQEGRQADSDLSEDGAERRQGIRSLNMNELEGGEITDLNEDELLAARIMRENGSTLNINA